MASIERTAYPHFSRVFTAREIQDAYTPTPEEILLARLHVRNNASLLAFLVLLKCFQRLQYFPPLPDVPAPVVDHVRSCLHLPPDLPLGCDQPKTLYRYHAIIREHLDVKAYKGKAARHTAVRAAYQAAEVMDQQTDLINATIDELVRQKYELPASTVGFQRLHSKRDTPESIGNRVLCTQCPIFALIPALPDASLQRRIRRQKTSAQFLPPFFFY